MKYKQAKEDQKAIYALLEAGLIDALEAREMREYLEELAEAS
jgi:hypothetical protein